MATVTYAQPRQRYWITDNRGHFLGWSREKGWYWIVRMFNPTASPVEYYDAEHASHMASMAAAEDPTLEPMPHWVWAVKEPSPWPYSRSRRTY